jgi:hypothetical protein
MNMTNDRIEIAEDTMIKFTFWKEALFIKWIHLSKEQTQNTSLLDDKLIDIIQFNL